MEFDNTPAPGDTPVVDDPSIQLAPLAERLVGDGKQFKDIEALAKGKTDADAFIEQLKNENASMREAVTTSEQESLKAATLSQVLEAVRTLSDSGNPNDPAPAGDGSIDGNQPALSKEDILNLVQRTLDKTDAKRAQDINFDSVRDAFLKVFKDGDKARLEYKATADGLGIKESQLDDFARMNPELVIRAAGLKPAFTSDPSIPSYLANSENSEANKNKGVDGAKDHIWWDEQRRAKGNAWYFSTTIQQAYWRDAKALGDSFLVNK